MDTIPSVNLADFLSKHKNRKQKFINKIGHANENKGFVALKGHLLEDKFIEGLYSE
ncbi:MAG: isopenicillin N synthase family oxygenase, partial [Polaribacter sp.]